MKKNSKYIVLTAAIALCAGSSLPFLAGSSTLNPERDSVKSEVPYCVTSPSVPDKITFAGQAIDLLRYDHRERMDRELMSFTYMHSTTMLMVKRANRYFPVIEPILKANGLPDDFKYRHGPGHGEKYCLRERDFALSPRCRRFGRMVGREICLPDRVDRTRESTAPRIENTRTLIFLIPPCHTHFA